MDSARSVSLPTTGGNQYTVPVESEDLRAAEAHIAWLEEELLRRKDVQRELEQLRAEHQRLRRRVEGRAVQILTAPFHAFRRRAREIPRDESAYQKWFERHRASAAQLGEMRSQMRSWATPPLISVLLPTYESNLEFLRQAIESMQAQVYQNWELLIADDGSTNPALRAFLADFEKREPRLRLVPPGEHGGISEALNRALASAQGEWIALLDHDDWLEPDALFRVGESLCESPEVDVFYSDEDKIVDGNLAAPMFKPDWSPDLFLAHDYLGHFVAVRRHFFANNTFRREFDGAQDYDFLLRVIEQTNRIRHLPRVLYHWRRTPQSTAHNIRRKPGALEAGRRALEEHLARTGTPGRVTIDWPTHVYRVRREAKSAALTIIDEMKDDWRETDGEFICFLDRDLQPQTENWQRVMLEYLADENVGAVGGRILTSENLIENAGYILGADGVARAAFAGRKESDAGEGRQLQMPRNYGALSSSCLLTRRRDLQAFSMGKDFSPAVAIEFCLRLREEGSRVLSVPYAVFRRVGKSPAQEVHDPELQRRHPRLFAQDPFYNPNLARARADFSYDEAGRDEL